MRSPTSKIAGPRPARCSVVHSNSHRAVISRSATLFSNDETSPTTKPVTFGLASIQAAVPTAATSEPNLCWSEWTAFILVEPIACAGPSLGLREASPPVAIAEGLVGQASHNYPAFVKVAVILAVAVFSVSSSPFTAIAIVVVRTARGFVIFANFTSTEGLRAKVAAKLPVAFLVAQ